MAFRACAEAFLLSEGSSLPRFVGRTIANLSKILGEVPGQRAMANTTPRHMATTRFVNFLRFQVFTKNSALLPNVQTSPALSSPRLSTQIARSNCCCWNEKADQLQLNAFQSPAVESNLNSRGSVLCTLGGLNCKRQINIHCGGLYDV
jgi:hypothetical protein